MNTKSREHNSIVNILVGVGNQVIMLFLNMLSKKIFIDKLGHEYLGINGLFTNLFLLFSFAEFGMGSIMIYSLYQPIAKKDKEKIAALFQFFRNIYGIMSLIIAFVGVGIFPLLPIIVKTENNIPYLWFYYLLFLGNTVVGNLFIYRTYLITADQKQYILSFNQLIFDGIGFLSQIVILILTSNYVFYLVVVWVKTICSTYVIGKKVKRLYPFLSKNVELQKEEKRTLLFNIKEVFIYKFARVLITGTDNIIISVLFSTVLVGYYSNYDLVITGVLSFIAAMYAAVSASVGNFFAEKDEKSQYKVFMIVQNISIWMIGFTTTCLFLLIQDFLRLWFGKGILLDWKIVIIIIFNYYIHCVRDSTKMFREASGLFVKVKNVMCITAVLNIILSIILGKLLGVAGVFLGTAISTLSTAYWFEPFLLHKTRFRKPLLPYFKNQAKCFLLTILSIGITYGGTVFLKEVTWTTFFLKTVICVIVSNVFYLCVMYKTESFQYIFGIILKFITRKKKKLE